MKRLITRLWIGPVAAVLFVGAGCARVKLAARSLTPEEEAWADHIGTWYEKWTPPYYSPVQPVVPASAYAAPSSQPPRLPPADLSHPMAAPSDREDFEFVPAGDTADE